MKRGTFGRRRIRSWTWAGAWVTLAVAVLLGGACGPASSGPSLPRPAAERGAAAPASQPAPASVPTQLSSPPESLHPGRPVERPLAPEAIHTWLVDAPAGALVRVVATQRGVDLLLEIPIPGAEPLLVDRPTAAEGEEVAEWIAGPGAPSRMVVRAFALSAAGRYALRLEPPRPATPADRRRVEGLARCWRAEAAARQGDEDGRRLAAAGFAEAAAELAGSGAYEEGMALARLAELADLGGDSAAAVPLLERAVGVARRRGDPQQEVALETDLAEALWRAGERPRAAAVAERALAGARARGDRGAEGRAANVLGLALRDLGRLEEAIEAFRAALAVLEEGDSASEAGGRSGDGGAIRSGAARDAAVTRENLGATYVRIGRTAEGRSLLERALAAEEAGGGAQQSTLVELAWALHLEGRSEESLPVFGRALESARAAGDRLAEAGALDRRASALAALGRRGEVRRDYEAALALSEAGGNLSAAAHGRTNLGAVALAEGDPAVARAACEEARAAFAGLGEPSGEAAALACLARAERALGRPEAALGHLEAAAGRIETMRRGLGSRTLRREFLDVHYRTYEEWVDLLMELEVREPGAGWARRAFAVAEGARALALREALAAAPGTARRRAPPALLEREREAIAALVALEERRQAELAGRPDSPLARALGDRLRLGWLEVEAIRAEIEGSAVPRSVPPRSAESVQRDLLDADTALVAYFLGEPRSYAWIVTHDRFLSRELPGRAAIEATSLALYRRWSQAPERDAGGRPRPDPEAVRLAAELAAQAIAPIAPALASPRLVVIPDGALHLLPFGALPTPGRPGEPLLAGRELVAASSASVLAALRARPRAPAGLVAILADPVFTADDPRLAPGVRRSRTAEPAAPGDGGPRAAPDRPPAGFDPSEALSRSARAVGLRRFERLPATSLEARRIAAAAGERLGLIAVGPEASREVLESGTLSRFGVVHVASHGVLDEDNPEFSGILLSLVDAAGRPRDGFLRLHDLAALDLSAELVVLSACRTALGRQVRGEGLVGLTQGLFTAGARRVVVSHWGVDDVATADLMGRFYQAFLGDGLAPAAALARAARELRADPRWRDPYFWAPFTLQGDWE